MWKYGPLTAPQKIRAKSPRAGLSTWPLMNKAEFEKFRNRKPDHQSTLLAKPHCIDPIESLEGSSLGVVLMSRSNRDRYFPKSTDAPQASGWQQGGGFSISRCKQLTAASASVSAASSWLS